MASLLMSQISQLLVSHHYNLHCAKKKREGKGPGSHASPSARQRASPKVVSRPPGFIYVAVS